MPNFELYDRKRSGPRAGRTPTVTIQRRGLMSFSPPAIAMLGNPEAIVFLYDKAENMIGFRRGRARERNSYDVRAARSGTHLVSASAFLRFLDLDLSESRRYPLQMVDGTPCVDLKQPGTLVTSNRRKQVPASAE